MNLTNKEIEHIANLARLKLTDKEKKLYQEQLSRVLEYFDQLKEVDTESIEPTAQVTGLVNIMREDNIDNWEEEEKRVALEQAPEQENGQVKVKRVLN